MNEQTTIPIRTLTVIIPCYNEEKYVHQVLDRLLAADIPHPVNRQIIVVNDGSTDNTKRILDNYQNAKPDAGLLLLHIPVNRGKGYAIRTALPHVTGDALIIQDADLEYNPSDMKLLLAPLMNGEAEVALGSRFRGNGPHRGPFFLHKWVNKSFTFLSNLLTRQRLSDIHTCYKMFRTDVIRRIPLKENRFGFDPEVIAKLSHLKDVRIREVGISYQGRNFSEGKKISFTDGFRAFYCIIRYNLFPGKKEKSEAS